MILSILSTCISDNRNAIVWREESDDFSNYIKHNIPSVTSSINVIYLQCCNLFFYVCPTSLLVWCAVYNRTVIIFKMVIFNTKYSVERSIILLWSSNQATDLKIEKTRLTKIKKVEFLLTNGTSTFRFDCGSIVNFAILD